VSRVFALLGQQFAPETLGSAVRAVTGKSQRRTARLHQLVVLGALACLPPSRRDLPTALLWQSCSGPREETQTLLQEICQGDAEPMPYDFLATQPALAAPQLREFLPGLQMAAHFPLASETRSGWGLMLHLADDWLKQGRYAQVLCAQLDSWQDDCRGSWLALAGDGDAGVETLARLEISTQATARVLADRADLPACLAAALPELGDGGVSLPGGYRRWPVFRTGRE
jgi:hypothetical protein